jgi:hypothetical protein
MVDDIKRFEPSNIPLGTILANLGHIPAAMTEEYVRSEQLAENKAISIYFPRDAYSRRGDCLQPPRSVSGSLRSVQTGRIRPKKRTDKT